MPKALFDLKIGIRATLVTPAALLSGTFCFGYTTSGGSILFIVNLFQTDYDQKTASFHFDIRLFRVLFVRTGTAARAAGSGKG